MPGEPLDHVDGNTWALRKQALKTLINYRVILVLNLAGCTASFSGILVYEGTTFRLRGARCDLTLHPAGIHSIIGNTITITR